MVLQHSDLYYSHEISLNFWCHVTMFTQRLSHHFSYCSSPILRIIETRSCSESLTVCQKLHRVEVNLKVFIRIDFCFSNHITYSLFVAKYPSVKCTFHQVYQAYKGKICFVDLAYFSLQCHIPELSEMATVLTYRATITWLMRKMCCTYTNGFFSCISAVHIYGGTFR